MSRTSSLSEGGRRTDRGFIFRFECKTTTTTCAEVDSASSYPHFLSALLCSLCLAKLRRRRTGRERGRHCAAGREGEGAREEEYAVAAARAKGALPFAYYAAPPPPTTTCEKNKPGPSTRAASQRRRGENRKEGASRRGREGGRSNRSGDSNDVEEELIPRPPTDSIDNGLSDVVVCSATSVQIE